MALLFIKASEGAEDASGFQKYDIVEVLEDGADAGRLVYLETFLIVRVPEKTRDDLLYLIQPLEQKQLEFPDLPAQLLKVRQYKFDFDAKMTEEQLAAIRASVTLLIPDIDLSDIEEKE